MKNIFAWEKIYTNKTSGNIKATCPECIDSRTNKKDKSLQVNFTNGIAHCHYCHAISFRDSIEKKTEQNFKLPIQTWRNYTQLSDSIVKALELRKIQQSTAIAFGITEEWYYQPQLQKEVNNLVFNYFEGDILINKKYRGRNKTFTQSAGSKSIFYNLNAIIGAEEIYIVEGEFDCLAMYEIGIKNCISLPNGANDNDNVWINCEKYLKDVKKFLIATDNDEKGNEVADKIAQRLGRWRCERVLFSHKDANDDLIDGCLKNSVLNRLKYPTSGIFNAEDVHDDVLDIYKNGLPPRFYPKHPSFGDLKNIFTVMRGHLVTVTGIPSHGKSNFVDWYVLNLVKDHNMKASFFSPEHYPLELHQSTFIEKAFGKNFFKEMSGIPRITVYDVEKYTQWANEKIYFAYPENGECPTWNWLLDKMKEQMIIYGTDIFVIDAFNKLAFDEKGSRFEFISDILTKLTLFAQINNVIIFLVAHPTKMQKKPDGLYTSPTLYDISGSADFRNQTHDGFSIYRYFGDEENEAKTVFENLKTKMKFQGEIGGQVEYDYHIPSGRYYEFGTEYEPFNLLTWDQEIDLFNAPTLAEIPNVFEDIPFGEEENDVPF